MNRFQAKALLPIIQAFSEGATVQVRRRGPKSNPWLDVQDPDFKGGYSSVEYRIKPEPRIFMVRPPGQTGPTIEASHPSTKAPLGWIKVIEDLD